MLLGDAAVLGIIPATDLERASAFWKDLGLSEASRDDASHEVVFEAGRGTYFAVYERAEATKAEHTVIGFDVRDLDAAMTDLRAHGVRFEEYDMPGLKTYDGVAQMGDTRGAWFKDSEGNIISIAEGLRGRMLAGSGMTSSATSGMGM